MEQRSLDHVVIIKGIEEAEEETEHLLKNNIYNELAATVVETPMMRGWTWQSAWKKNALAA